MQLVIFNTTGSTITFLSGAISVAASGSTSVTNSVQQLALATDGSFRYNIVQNNIYITDGTNSFGSQDALNYLLSITQNIGPTSDGVGNSISSVNGQLQSRDLINTSWVGAIVSVGTTPVQVKAGASVLVNRKYALVRPLNGIVYEGSSNSVTSSTGNDILKKERVVKSFTDNVGNWYVVAASGTVNVWMEEGS